jgi:phage shock protein PspC (stress-responsive transcriptional regulator)
LPRSAEQDEEAKEKQDATEPSKRLYTLKEGAIIGGVCNGLAVFLNVDVTIVRLAFIILVFVTSGFWIVVYLLMMLIVPEARTPEQKAELRGERFTAQDVLDKAKKKYVELSDTGHWHSKAKQSAPMLSNVGQALLKLLHLAATMAAVVLAIAVGVLTAGGVGCLSWLIVANPHFTDQLSTISHWTVAAGITAAYFLMMLPLLALAYLFDCMRNEGLASRWSSRRLGLAGLLWVAALGTLIGVTAVTGGRLNDYQNTHGTVNLGTGHTVCINRKLCNGPTRGYYYHYHHRD